MLLADKVVIVSGVGPGLGRALVLEAAGAGASIVAVARTEAYLREVVSEAQQYSGQVLAVPGDITSTEDCARIATMTEHAFGRVDGLVSNAFTAGTIGLFEDIDLDDWRRTYEVNVFGTLSLIRAALPLLKRARGVVLNVSSTSALRPMRRQGGYASSKAAMEFLTRQLAVELGPSGVRLNTVYCGPMEGPNLTAALERWAQARDESVEQTRAAVAANIAQGRIPEDDDAARLIVLLLSDRAAVMTGSAVHATGGAWLEQRI